MYDLNDLKDSKGKFISYTDLGGYPVYYIAQGEAYCPSCANQEDADPEIEAHNVNWEDPELFCEGCSKRIESAYAEDDVN